jgi:hypothetical protein
MNEEDAQTAALQEYFDSDKPAGYGAAFRAESDRTCRCCGVIFHPSRPRPDRGVYCSRTCSDRKVTQSFTTTEDGLAALFPLFARGGLIRSYATIDASDIELVQQWHWSLSNGYVIRRMWAPTQRKIYLHRELLGLTPGDGLEGDHRDRDRLNNRRSNLRIVTHNGNKQNKSSKPGASSQYRGVRWHKRAGKWAAEVQVNGKHHHLGLFTDEYEAGEVARLGRARLMPYAVD